MERKTPFCICLQLWLQALHLGTTIFLSSQSIPDENNPSFLTLQSKPWCLVLPSCEMYFPKFSVTWLLCSCCCWSLPKEVMPTFSSSWILLFSFMSIPGAHYKCQFPESLAYLFFCYFLPLRSSVLPLYCCGYLHLCMKLISFHHLLPLPAVLLSCSLLQHGRKFFCSRCARENRACPPFWQKPAYPASQLAPLPEPQWDHRASSFLPVCASKNLQELTNMRDCLISFRYWC